MVSLAGLWPVQDSAAVAVVPPPLTTRLPVFTPAPVGLQATSTVQEAPAASEAPHLVMAVIAVAFTKSAPLRFTVKPPRAAPPELVTVKVVGALVSPTPTPWKSLVIGVMARPPVVPVQIGRAHV